MSRLNQRQFQWPFSLAIAVGAIACGGNDEVVLLAAPATAVEAVGANESPDNYAPGVPFGPPESIFDREHLVEVVVELDPKDWETLRREGMSRAEFVFPTGRNGIRTAPEFTEFSGQVWIDGVLHDNVVIRKKGNIGSLSVLRPSLKLNFSKNFDEPIAAGMKRMTLNNDRQDPSHTHQCLTYDMFANAGLPSPRCNFAHVVVNGVDLGIYTHLEGIKRPMLSRFFEDTSGNLYEGEQTDFTKELGDQLELKTNESANERGDIQRVIEALAIEDDSLMVEALREVVDLDSFFDFWAVEALVGHWDGYAGSRNNFRAYHDPTTDKFYFIPWGADQTFQGPHPEFPERSTEAGYARGAIAARLYAVAELQERFRTRLGELNEQLWDVPTLLASIDQIASVAWDAAPGNLAVDRSFVRHRGDTLRAQLLELAPSPAEVVVPAPPVDDCVGTTRQLSGSFSGQWMNSPSFGLEDVLGLAPEFSGSLELEGESIGGEFHTLVAGGSQVPEAKTRRVADFYHTAIDAEGRSWTLNMLFGLQSLSPGYHPFHGFESMGRLFMVDMQSGDFQSIGEIGEGGITLDRVDLREGHAVQGSFHATLYLAQCVQTAIEASEQARQSATGESEAD